MRAVDEAVRDQKAREVAHDPGVTVRARMPGVEIHGLYRDIRRVQRGERLEHRDAAVRRDACEHTLMTSGVAIGGVHQYERDVVLPAECGQPLEILAPLFLRDAASERLVVVRRRLPGLPRRRDA